MFKGLKPFIQSKKDSDRLKFHYLFYCFQNCLVKDIFLLENVCKSIGLCCKITM